MVIDWGMNTITYASFFKGALGQVSAFIFALAMSLALTPACRTLVKRLGMIDKPDARRINKVPIPRGGGIAVIITVLGTLWTWVFLAGHTISQCYDAAWLVAYTVASLALATLGFVDDKWGVKARLKLFIQIGVATFLFLNDVRIGGILVAFPIWLDYLITVFWIVGAINAFNLIDGLDGLASGLAIIASLGMAGSIFFAGDCADILPYLVLAGACCGFLRYNFHPASVFLGDTGSMFIGLSIAVFPLLSGGSRMGIIPALGVPLLAMGVPIFDTMLAIWRRSVRALLNRGAGHEGGLMDPDKDHVHHRLLRQVLNQRKVALSLYLFSVLLVSVGLVGLLLKGRAPGFFMIAFVVGCLIVVRHLIRVELWDTGRLLTLTRPALRNSIAVPFFIVFDISSMFLAWCFASYLLHCPITRSAVVNELPYQIVPLFIVLVIGRIYKRVWARAQIRDFVFMTIVLGIGFLLGNGLRMVLNDSRFELTRMLLQFNFVLAAMIGVRVANDIMYGVCSMIESMTLSTQEDTVRVLAYGAGLNFRGYMRQLMAHVGQNTSVVIGLIDDNKALHQCIVSGYIVYGGLNDVPDIVAKQRINRIVITCPIKEENRIYLLALAQRLQIEVTQWQMCEVSLLKKSK